MPLSLTSAPRAAAIRNAIDRAWRKSFVRAIKPLRRLLRNQGAVNDSLIEAANHLLARTDELVAELSKLQRSLSALEIQIRQLRSERLKSELTSALESSAAREWQAEIDKIDWYHEFDFGNGLRTQPRPPNLDAHRRLWQFIEDQLDQLDFIGKSVLDVGAWDGYWSFYSERRGARSVLATDDASQNWSSGNGLQLARKLLGSHIEIRQDLPIYELGSLNRKFDIILCLGVFYHLRDPFYGFVQLRHCCHSNSILAIEGELGSDEAVSNGERYCQGDWMERLLSESGLRWQLKSAYFQVESIVRLNPEANVDSDRGFIICRPITGKNDMYVYKPHFGLHLYDDRFNQAG